jgi:hypothetical protein
MIVRILHEGQFELHGAELDKLNEIDNQIVEAVSSTDAAAFERLLAGMLDFVRKSGRKLAVDDFRESDIILPSADSTIEDAEGMFTGEGLIPEYEPEH